MIKGYCKTEQKKKQPLTPEKIVLLVTTGVCILCVLIVVIVQIWFNPKQLAERKLDKLSREYYEIYLYPQLTRSGRDLNEIFAAYEESGVPVTYLRQLLLYNNSEHGSDAVYFQNDAIYCDTNKTGVHYYPYAPYGPYDYKMELLYSCKES